MHLLAVLASVVYLIAILAALRGSRMTIRQSLLWLTSGAAFLLLSFFPSPVIWAAQCLGFAAPSNAAFITWLLTLTVLLFHQSLTTSRHADQVKALCQEIALLKARTGDTQ
jgi:hypothetical protein